MTITITPHEIPNLATFDFSKNPNNEKFNNLLVAAFNLSPYKQGYVVMSPLGYEVLLLTPFMDVAADFVKCRAGRAADNPDWSLLDATRKIYSSTPLGDIYKVF